MRLELIIQNIFHLFVIAIILELAVSSIFSLKFFQNMAGGRSLETLRDLLIFGLACYICYKVPHMTIFKGTGVKVPRVFNTAVTALIITSLANFVQNFMARIKMG